MTNNERTETIINLLEGYDKEIKEKLENEGDFLVNSNDIVSDFINQRNGDNIEFYKNDYDSMNTIIEVSEGFNKELIETLQELKEIQKILEKKTRLIEYFLKANEISVNNYNEILKGMIYGIKKGANS